MIRVFLVLGSSVWQEGQIPTGLLAVSLTIKSVSIVDKKNRNISFTWTVKVLDWMLSSLLMLSFFR